MTRLLSFVPYTPYSVAETAPRAVVPVPFVSCANSDPGMFALRGLLGDQLLQLSAARDNLLFFNVSLIKTQKVTRTNFLCCLLTSALETHFWTA